MTVKYAFQKFDNHCAKASGQALPISVKSAINICNKIKGMDAQKAVAYLHEVAQLNAAVPFTRFTDGVGHRRGNMASGRYPVKAAQAIANVLKGAIANAEAKNFDEKLTIIHINANKAARPMHQGRQRRREMKRTHVEIVLKETTSLAEMKKVVPKKAAVKKEKEEQKAKPAPKPTPKVEDKKVQTTSSSQAQEKQTEAKA